LTASLSHRRTSSETGYRGGHAQITTAVLMGPGPAQSWPRALVVVLAVASADSVLYQEVYGKMDNAHAVRTQKGAILV
jgi:hypothetical protein